MDLAGQVARMFGVGFAGVQVPGEIDTLIARGVRCVILFKRNVESSRQVQHLCADLKARAGSDPLAMTIDHEGGRVLRLRGDFTNIPSAREIGRADDTGLAREIGSVIARELRAVNIDVDFAPVLDVDTNPNNPVIASRSYSPDPRKVSRLGCALIDGLQSHGVAACAKHFPGHGDTSQDSHLTLPRLDHDLDRLQRVELLPFKSAIDCRVASIMTSHIVFSAIDPDLPATMSTRLLKNLLRDQLGFTGVIVSDDLEMKAINANFGIEQTMIRGAVAGVNLFMICHNHPLQHQAIDLLVRAVERGDVPRRCIEESNARLDALFEKYVRPATRNADDLKLIGSAGHLKIVNRIQKLAGPAKCEEDPTERWRAGETPL